MNKGKVFIVPVFLTLIVVLSTLLYAEEPASKQKKPSASPDKGGQKASAQTSIEDDPGKIIATVNSLPITLKDVRKRAQLVGRDVAYHTQISDEKKQEIMEKALDQLIVEELAYQEAKKTGVTALEKDINNRFNEVKGRFPSEESFNKSLEANSLDINKYKKLIEKELLIQKINEKLFGKPVTLSSKEVKDYFEKNREKFIEPEKIRLRQILIKVPAFASKEEWEKGKNKAEEILSEIKAGKDFAELAKEFSSDPSREKGGDMGFIHKGRLEPYIETIAYSMKVGEISDVLQTIYGYHIIKLEEKKQPQYTKFSKIKEKLKKDLETVAMEEKKKNWIKELREKAEIKYYVSSDKKD